MMVVKITLALQEFFFYFSFFLLNKNNFPRNDSFFKFVTAAIFKKIQRDTSKLNSGEKAIGIILKFS